VGLLTKKEDRQLVAGRADLGAAQRRLSALLAREDAASASADRWALWTAERDAAAAEVARLTALVAKLEADAEAVRAEAEAEALRKRLAAARKGADDLAIRIKTDGQRIVAELLQLAREAPQQALEAKFLNANLPEGEVPVLAADILARDAGALPRENQRSREVSLWVVAGTGAIVGNQGAVISSDGITGELNSAYSSMRPRCIRRKFKETVYIPSQIFDWPGALYASLKLPSFTGPGLLFDGSTLVIEDVAALDIEALLQPAKQPQRATQIEINPYHPKWPPPGEQPRDAGRNATA
jgi:hypothetical protein